MYLNSLSTYKPLRQLYKPFCLFYCVQAASVGNKCSAALIFFLINEFGNKCPNLHEKN